MKMEMKMKNRSHRYDTNKRRSRHGATFEAQFRKKLSNTETELKKIVAYKEACNLHD